MYDGAMRDLKPHDLYQLRFLSDLQPGPEGSVFYVETSIAAGEGGETPSYRPRLWTCRDGRRRRLTAADAERPRWDGGRYVYFLRKEGGAKQLFRLDLEGGEPEPLTSFAAGVEGFETGPGGAVAVLTRGDEKPASPDAPRVYEHLPFKFDGVGLLPEKTLQARVLEPGGGWSEPSALPTDIDALAWAPDGSLVLVASGSFEERRRWVQRLYRWRPGGEARAIGGGFGPVSDPVVSGDGAWVHFVGYDWASGIGASPGVWRLPLAGGAAERLTPEALYVGLALVSDVHYGDYGRALAPDGKGGFWLAVTEAGEGRLYRLRADGTIEGPLELPGSLAAFAVGADGGVRHVLLEEYQRPPALFAGGELRYDPNSDLLEGLPAPEPFFWKSPDGHEVPGWVLLPEGEGPHPAVLYVHGGPHAAYGRAMLFEFYLLRARGLAVVYANPRGSVGYGQAYAQIKGRWGEADAADLLGFLDAAVERFGLDHERQGVAGGSYGGFMTNWLTARHPERFKAAVTQRSICNWTSFWGASDIGIRFSELELGAGLWEDPVRYWQKSPLAHAHALKTPTLVVHAERDHRCPIDQGETWFAALVSRGVPARFLRVPEEGHELSRSGRPDRRVKRLEEIVDWMAGYL